MCQCTASTRSADHRVAPQWVTNRTLAMLLFQLNRLERDLKQREASLAELVAGETDPAVLHHRAGHILGVLADLDWLYDLHNDSSGELDRRPASEARIGRFPIAGRCCRGR